MCYCVEVDLLQTHKWKQKWRGEGNRFGEYAAKTGG